jgi:hypothetical protein
VVAGLVAGLVLAPAAAVAATMSAEQLVGGDGITAVVTKAGQVETGQVNPGTFRAFHDYGLFGSTCDRAYTTPAGYAFVLESISVDVYDAGTPGPGVNVRVATNSSCSAQLVDFNPRGVGATSVVLNPGVVVPSGASLYAIGDNGADAELYGFGYLEPAADAPSGTSAQPGVAAVTPLARRVRDAATDHPLAPFP